MKFKDFKYERLDIEKVSNQYREALNRMDTAKNAEEFLKAMKDFIKIDDHVSTMFTLVKIRHSINTLDEFYENEQKFVDDNGPRLSEFKNLFYKALLKTEFKDDIVKKYGQHILNLAEIMQKTFSLEVVDDLIEENKLISQYGKLLASAKIDFEGEIRNMSGLGPFMQSPDRSMRKKATAALADFLGENRKEFDEIYDKLVKLRTKIAKKLGYENFVELGYNRMKRTDYDKYMVKEYREQIKRDVVPLATKLLLEQKERIGVDKLYYYDENLLFTSGNANPHGDPEFIIKGGIDMYSKLSPETKEFFDHMVEGSLMDLETKAGKKTGGYCTIIADYKTPFIFSNFNGTAGDIDVLTHEAGHAFQMYRSINYDLSEYRFPTLDACEIHSMSMEFFTHPFMKNFFKEDTDKYLYTHVSDNVKFLPYGAMVDDFQHFAYENPDCTIEERNEYWKKIEKEYLPLRDYDDIEYFNSGRFWQKQGHIYMDPMYYIDYTLAEVCALQYFVWMQENKEEAWKSYLKLCNLGGSYSFTELVKRSGLKVPFEEGTIKSIMPSIEKYLESFKDKNLK